MLKTTEAKINTALSDYINGDLKDAARRIRSMTKVELAQMLVEHHQTDMGRVFIGEPSKRYDLEQFIIRSLLG